MVRQSQGRKETEVALAIATVDARKKAIGKRPPSELRYAASKTNSKPRKKKRLKKESLSKGAERDIYLRGYRLAGSAWAGKSQK